MQSLSIFMLMLSFPLQAGVPTLKARGESAPIPAGFTDSDDAAVWLDKKNPSKSLVLGTSKYEEDGKGGLGVYSLDGREKQFFGGAKLNSVDLIGDLAVATNRSDNALDVYRIERGVVEFVRRSQLTDSQGEALEPYGLCLHQDKSRKTTVYLPTKSGTLFQYELSRNQEIQLKGTVDLAGLVSPEQDERIRNIVSKETFAEGEAEELEENLAERFILEGCVVDETTHKLYVGMENLGIWSIDLSRRQKPELVIPVQGSWTDIDSWQSPDKPRVTDDIEGLDILYIGGKPFLLFSSQGISEFTLYDLSDMKWRGNFKISYGSSDPVTFTDGLAVKKGYLNQDYPEGVLVVHDDENTDENGKRNPANYKFVSLADLWKAIPLKKHL